MFQADTLTHPGLSFANRSASVRPALGPKTAACTTFLSRDGKVQPYARRTHAVGKLHAPHFAMGNGSRSGSAQDRGKLVRFPDSETADHPPFHKRIIPGIIAGAADLDPCAVLTATVAGASFRFSVGWVVLLCIPILIQVFGVSARIGHETRLGLIRLVHEHFGKRTAVALAVMVVTVNVLMIVADIMAVSDGVSMVLQVHQPGRPARSEWVVRFRSVS